jgi:hypothetical protein
VGDGNERVELWVGWVLCGFCRHGSSLPCAVVESLSTFSRCSIGLCGERNS